MFVYSVLHIRSTPVALLFLAHRDIMYGAFTCWTEFRLSSTMQQYRCKLSTGRYYMRSLWMDWDDLFHTDWSSWFTWGIELSDTTSWYSSYFDHTEKKTHAVWSSGQNGRVDRRQGNSDCSSPEWVEKASWATLHLLDSLSEERPSSAQPYLGGCYRTGSE